MDDERRRSAMDLGDRLLAARETLGYGRLTEGERTAFCVYNLAVQVANGGFAQFLANTGWAAGPTVRALESAGLPATAGLLREALSEFAGSIDPDRPEPLSPPEFEGLAERLAGMPEQVRERLDALDRRYYAREEDIYEGLLSYSNARPGGIRGADEIDRLAEQLDREREELDQRRQEAIRALDQEWSRKERTCPACGHRFTAARNFGKCPACGLGFRASHPEGPGAFPFDPKEWP